MSGISLEKVQSQAPELVKLYKDAGAVILEKGLRNESAAVAAVVDHSASMSPLYENGFVQSAVEKVLAASFHFDDGKIPVVLFDSKAHEPFIVSIENFRGAVRQGYMGTTNYAAAMQKILEVHKQEISQGKPVFVVFFTDGEPNSRADAEKVIRESSDKSVFWMFVGVGGNRFPFLEKLDDLKNRVVDNADFFVFNRGMTDKELYNKMMNEFPYWLAETRRRGIVRV
jgi:uncharacterized protein YegL